MVKRWIVLFPHWGMVMNPVSWQYIYIYIMYVTIVLTFPLRDGWPKPYRISYFDPRWPTWLCLGPLNPVVDHHGSHFLRAPFWRVYSLPSLYPLTSLPLWSRPEEGCWLIYMFSCSVWYVFQQYYTEHVYNLYHAITHNKPQHHNYVEYGL